jgi:excinuclease UvrABC nuclease subunit
VKQLNPDFFKAIPNTPGVYFMLGERGEILYIGKAKRLRKRVFSYRQVKPCTHPPHQVELVRRIKQIRWETCRTEKLALERENELLHAIRPPYNIADTEEGSYLFITMRALGPDGRVEFQLTQDPDGSPSVRVFGCYRDRWQAKKGYGALLRLMYSATFQAKGRASRFSIPSNLRKPRIEKPYVIRFHHSPDKWISEVSRFLRGASLGFLRSLTESLIDNEHVPRFMGPSLQDDIDCAREFFKIGPKGTRLLKRKYAHRVRTLSHEEMDALIRRSVSFTIDT